MYLQYVLFTFVYNSLISVMPYKVYNELPGVGTAAKKALKSVIYYNVHNMMEWRHQDGRKWHTGVILHPCQHGGTRTGANGTRT